jgi:hypothetical protein
LLLVTRTIPGGRRLDQSSREFVEHVSLIGFGCGCVGLSVEMYGVHDHRYCFIGGVAMA